MSKCTKSRRRRSGMRRGESGGYHHSLSNRKKFSFRSWVVMPTPLSKKNSNKMTYNSLLIKKLTRRRRWGVISNRHRPPIPKIALKDSKMEADLGLKVVHISRGGICLRTTPWVKASTAQTTTKATLILIKMKWAVLTEPILGKTWNGTRVRVVFRKMR